MGGSRGGYDGLDRRGWAAAAAAEAKAGSSGLMSMAATRRSGW